MDIVVLVGRILLGSIAFGAALGGHFGATVATAAYAESRGVKNARPLVLFSGAMLLAAGLMLFLGIWADLGALIFIAFLLPTAFMVHHFWTDTDEMTKQAEMTNFMKNVSISGGCLLAFVLFASSGDQIGLQMVGPLFDISL